MLTMFEMLLPLILIVLITLPLIPVFKGKKSISTAKRRMLTHVCCFSQYCWYLFSLRQQRRMPLWRVRKQRYR